MDTVGGSAGKPALPRGWVRTLRLPLSMLLGLLISAWGGPIQAQTIRGQLLDRETGLGVEGALVLLLDQAGNEVGGVLTNEAGRFHIRAPNPGRYSLRAERIGYETVASEVIRLRSSPVSGFLLETGQSAIELEELRVEGEQQCVIRPAEGLELARVWDEARKALTIQEWTEGEDLYRFQLVRYQRSLHPDSRVTLSEEREGMVVVNRNPIRSLPARELLEEGFVRPSGDGAHLYYGPDASVLLSDLFLDTHCFRLKTSTDSPDLLGLSFEPVRQRDIPDIVGTLWLDRATAELVRLDYGYDWAPWAQVRGVAEGRVEFQKMATGAWIIQKWWIRMPVVGQVRGAATSGWPSLRLVEIREVGSEVAEVTSIDHQLIAPADGQPRGALRGVAWDSLWSHPLSEVTVFLSGTPYDALTDADGHFFMEGIPEGNYFAAVTHPALASLGIYPRRVEVGISAGDTADVQLGLPSRSSFLESVCGAAEGPVGDAFVTGRVRWGEGGDPTHGATVTLEWSRYKVNSAGAIIGRIRQEFQVVTDAHGRYRACGIPAGATLTAQASMGDSLDRGPPREVEVARDPVVVLDLILPLPRGGLAPSPRRISPSTSLALQPPLHKKSHCLTNLSPRTRPASSEKPSTRPSLLRVKVNVEPPTANLLSDMGRKTASSLPLRSTKSCPSRWNTR
jgi:hypothetical protein